jgi:2-succinyl-5-enolpyruvyl-6-hydroxy-3-cyclohexene-1-carboxylate synthase
MKTEANLLTDWATLLLGSFADAGITDVVISPGSRSTPFVVAAARNPRLRCHDSIDERAAAFFALGQARITGRPSLLICTSGTAGAHYLPAVIEAGLSCVPMVIVTADRPFELQQCGASQTIDQLKLFGDHARGFFELGSPDVFSGSLRSVRRIAAQAVAQSLWPAPGAVHVNARARKPLEPAAAETREELQLRDSVKALLASPIPSSPRPVMSLDRPAIDAAVRAIRGAKRGLIVAGPAPVAQSGARNALFRLAAAARFPLLVESASGLRFAGERSEEHVLVDAFDAVLRSRDFRRTARADLILQIGGFPVSSGFERYCSEHLDCPNLVLAPHGWHDPFSRSTMHLVADVEIGASQLADHLGPGASDSDRSAWLELFRAAQRASAEAAALAAEPEGGAINEASAARALVRAAPSGSTLLLGNSLAVRLVDTFAESSAKELAILSQRGAAGIDGLISGAAGAARSSDRALGLFLGDVSFFHDTTGLALARQIDHRPLVIVVVQNRGGRIFEQLPIAKAEVEPHVLSHITTPHAIEVEPLCRGFGIRHARPESRAALDAELQRAYRTDGCTVIEVVVPPSEAVAIFESAWMKTEEAMAPALKAYRA